jgi:hypothetical protein
MKKNTVVIAMWWTGVAIAATSLLISFQRQNEFDLSLRSPFDNTGSGHAEQWIFLREAAELVPIGARFTVTAPDRETEMSLFMMAVGLLPNATPLPTSYYGQPVSTGSKARFVLELEGPTPDQTPQARATEVAGGRVTTRLATAP